MDGRIGPVRLAALAAALALVAVAGSTTSVWAQSPTPEGPAESGPSAGPGDPGPADLLPNAERPLTHDELLAVRGEQRQNDATLGMLVADAVIVRSPQQGNPDRLAGGHAFGVLPREGHPGDPVVRADRVVKERYPADARIEGLVAIEHQGFNDALKFRGEVATPGGTYLTPIEPQTMAAADALPVGALIVAQGWLSRLASRSPAEVPKALERGDTGGYSSPFVRCPGGWLTAERVTRWIPMTRPRRRLRHPGPVRGARAIRA